jgi:hypothetical protein
LNRKISGIRAARTSRPRPPYLQVVPDLGADYDYDAAFRLVAQVGRAIASPEYLEGVIASYENSGHADLAASFTAAVAEQRAFAQDRAESGAEGVTA